MSDALVPPPDGPSSPERPNRAVGLLPLAAETLTALRSLAQAAADRLAGQLDLAGLAALIATATAHHLDGAHRLALVAAEPNAVHRALIRFAETGQIGEGSCVGQADRARPTVAFVCAGYGGQWAGMGHELARLEPTFADALDRCDRALTALGADWSMADVLDSDATDWLTDVRIALPMLVCIQLATAALWRSWGVEPDAVIGHSVGEVAAAAVAGVLTTEDAVRVGVAFGRVLSSRRGSGTMALVALPADEAAGLIEAPPESFAVVGLNGPRTTLLAGEPETLRAAVAEARRRRAFARMIEIDIPAHAPRLDPAAATEIAAALYDLRPTEPTRPIFSTVTCGPLPGAAFDGGHWGRSVVLPVRFIDALGRLLESGPVTVVELGPHPVLIAAIEEMNGVTRALASLRRGERGRATMLGTLGALWTSGQPVDWSAVGFADADRIGAALRRSTLAPDPLAQAPVPQIRRALTDLPIAERPDRLDP